MNAQKKLTIAEHFPKELMPILVHSVGVELEQMLPNQLEKMLHNPNLWKRLLSHYFPYLTTQNNLGMDFSLKDYQSLFMAEYQKLMNAQEYVGRDYTGTPYLLHALEGDVDKIVNAQIQDDVKNGLYVVAVTNSHWIALLHMDKRAKESALLRAAKIGAYQVLTYLLKHHKHSAKSKGLALKWAALNGHCQVAQILLEKGDFSAKQLQKHLAHSNKEGKNILSLTKNNSAMTALLEPYISNHFDGTTVDNLNADKFKQALEYPLNLLSERENECYRLLIKGFGYAQIAQKLKIATPTVALYLTRIKQKLKCSTKSELLLIAENAGLVDYHL
jgi:DNA-binding CsgD family transcriptional regulator